MSIASLFVDLAQSTAASGFTLGHFRLLFNGAEPISTIVAGPLQGFEASNG
jgi:hypothetical protein